MPLRKLKAHAHHVLANADSKVIKVGDLLAELIAELLDGFELRITVNGKSTMLGIQLNPQEDTDDVSTNTGPGETGVADH